jgi:hypothetical protein
VLCTRGQVARGAFRHVARAQWAFAARANSIPGEAIYGGALVAVRADEARAAEAADLMDRTGALDFEAQVRSWQTEGWGGYDPNARPFTPAEADTERRRRPERSLSVEQASRRSVIYMPPD